MKVAAAVVRRALARCCAASSTSTIACSWVATSWLARRCALALGGADIACIGDNCVDVYVDADPAGARRRKRTERRARDGTGGLRGRLLRRGRRRCARAADPQRAHAAAGVDVDGAEIRSGATGVTVVAHDAGGERRFVEEDYGVAAEYRIDTPAASSVRRPPLDPPGPTAGRRALGGAARRRGRATLGRLRRARRRRPARPAVRPRQRRVLLPPLARRGRRASGSPRPPSPPAPRSPS